MKMVFEALPFMGEQALEVESVQYELDKGNIPVDIIVVMSEKSYDMLEEYGLIPGNANRIEPMSDDWLMLYSRGKVTAHMTTEHSVYYEVIFARLKPFRIYNPDGKVMYM